MIVQRKVRKRFVRDLKSSTRLKACFKAMLREKSGMCNTKLSKRLQLQASKLNTLLAVFLKDIMA